MGRPDDENSPRPAVAALRTGAWRPTGKDLGIMAPGDSLWPSPAATSGEGLRGATFYGRFRRYLAQAGLPPAGLHILRYSAAKLRRDPGESIEGVSVS